MIVLRERPSERPEKPGIIFLEHFIVTGKMLHSHLKGTVEIEFSSSVLLLEVFFLLGLSTGDVGIILDLIATSPASNSEAFTTSPYSLTIFDISLIGKDWKRFFAVPILKYISERSSGVDKR